MAPGAVDKPTLQRPSFLPPHQEKLRYGGKTDRGPMQSCLLLDKNNNDKKKQAISELAHGPEAQGFKATLHIQAGRSNRPGTTGRQYTASPANTGPLEEAHTETRAMKGELWV